MTTHRAGPVLAHGPVDLADQLLPDDVMPATSRPQPDRRALCRAGTGARRPPPAPTAGAWSVDGHAAPGADRERGHKSVHGPAAGLRLPGPAAQGRTVPLDGDHLRHTWWLRIGYLRSEHAPVRVTAGDADVPGRRCTRGCTASSCRRAVLRRGAHRRPDTGTTLCVDTRSRSATPVPGGGRRVSGRDDSAEQEPRHHQFPVLDTLRAVGALAVFTTHAAFWAGAYTAPRRRGAPCWPGSTSASRSSSCCPASCSPARTWPGRAHRRARPPGSAATTGSALLRIYPALRRDGGRWPWRCMTGATTTPGLATGLVTLLLTEHLRGPPAAAPA